MVREIEAGKSSDKKGNHVVLPANGVYDYDNYIVGVEWDGGVQLRFIMSSGGREEQPELVWGSWNCSVCGTCR